MNYDFQWILSREYVGWAREWPYANVITYILLVSLILVLLHHAGQVWRRVAVERGQERRLAKSLPVVLDADGKPQRNARNLIRLTGWSPILSAPTPWSWTPAISAVLVGIGVFGTFVGLAEGIAGLQGVGVAGEEQDATELLNSIGGLITSMSLAFNTSILGLGASIVLVASDAILRWLRVLFGTALSWVWPTRFTIETPASLLAEQDHKAQADAARNLENAAHRLADSAKNFNADIIGARVAQAIQEVLTQEMLPTFQSMETSLQQIEKRMAEQNEDVIKRLFRELREEMIEPINVALARSIKQSGRVADVVKDLHISLGAVTEQLGQTTAEIAEFQKGTLERMEGFATSLGDSLNDFRDETKGLVEQVGQQVVANITQAGDTASGLIDHARESLDTTLRKTNETVQTELEHFRVQYQASLDSFFQEQNQLLDQALGEHRRGLSDVVERLTSVFEDEAKRHSAFMADHDQVTEKLRATVGDIQQLLELTGATRAATHEQLREIAADLNKAHGSVARSLQRIQSTVDNMTATNEQVLQDGVKAVEEFVGSARTSYETSFSAFDESIERILNNIRTTAESLQGSTQDLRTSILQVMK